jgi:diguanylate cyclase (GGDEF)-like protein/putative nucleotidyltransferase with HDIG domain
MQTRETASGDIRPELFVLHHRTATLPFSPADMASCGAAVRTASYGPETLRDILRGAYRTVAVYLDAHVSEAASFVGEVSRMRPLMNWIVISDASPPWPGSEKLFDRAPVVMGSRTSLSEVCNTALAMQAAEKNRPGSDSSPDPLFKSLLDVLSQAMRSAIRSSTVVGAVKAIGSGLGGVLPNDVVCVLGLGEENVIYISSRKPVHKRIVEALERECAERYRAMSGRQIDTRYLRHEMGRIDFVADAPASFAASMSVPVFVEDEIGGILLVASLPGSSASAPSCDPLPLHVAADHVGMVLGTVRGVRGLASRDPLTGVLNRMGMEDALERAWLTGSRHGFPVAVVVADIDGFKHLNDAYGHAVGDDILVEFAGVFQSAARGSDIIARYGGDEFVAILSQADERAARSLAERLLLAVRRRVFCKDTRGLRLTASIGLSTSKAPVTPTTSADLFSQADRALYVAKREGRNRFCVWPEETDALDHERPDEPEPGKKPQPAPGTAVASGRVMVVDDEPMVRSVVGDILRRSGHQVDDFDSADAAIEAMRKAGRYDYGIVLTDLNMPGKSGIELLQEMAAVNDIPVKIVITGFATVSNAVSSLREGAYDFVQKPVRAAQLQAIVSRALEYRRLRIENARYNEHLEELVRERSAQLAATLEEVRRSHEFTLEALVAMLDARENQTARHSVRVRRLATALGEKAGLADNDLQTLSRAALLHDIGKISVPDAVLLKPGPLLAEEWEIMRRHPEAGYRILRSGTHLKDVAEVVLSHHEWFDGTGYPRGLKGKDICLGARIFAVGDAYEAMRSERVYRQALDADTAAAQLVKGRGTQFDPAIVDLVIKYQTEFERILANA